MDVVWESGTTTFVYPCIHVTQRVLANIALNRGIICGVT